MKVQFVTRVFMPNNDFVMYASTPTYNIEILPTGWVKVIDTRTNEGRLFPAHQVEMIMTDDHKAVATAPTSPPPPVEAIKRPRGRPPKAP